MHPVYEKRGKWGAMKDLALSKAERIRIDPPKSWFSMDFGLDMPPFYRVESEILHRPPLSPFLVDRMHWGALQDDLAVVIPRRRAFGAG
jgi:hypothetical protein